MQISFNGVRFLKEAEGFKNEAYLDSGGVWTIGYGTIKYKGKPVEAGQTITEAEAEVALVEDLAWAQTAVNRLVRVPIKQNMFDALVSLVYNIGETAFSKSTLLKLLNSGMYKDAATQFERWSYVKGKIVRGLLNRRQRERAMFDGT